LRQDFIENFIDSLCHFTLSWPLYPIHDHTYFCKIDLNIIQHSCSSLYILSKSFSFPRFKFFIISVFRSACYTYRPSHPPLIDASFSRTVTHIQWSNQIVVFLARSFTSAESFTWHRKTWRTSCYFHIYISFIFLYWKSTIQPMYENVWYKNSFWLYYQIGFRHFDIIPQTPLCDPKPEVTWYRR
jgi:hypothetical protein